MNQFMVNGISAALPDAMAPESGFGDLIKYIEATFTSETSLLKTIRIDGVEMGYFDQGELAIVPLSGIRSVEVFTTSLKELAEETLQELLPYCEGLSDMSMRVAADLTGHQREFRQLIDGIEMLIESVVTVRMTLRAGAIQSVKVLEAELLSIMKDLLDAQQAGRAEYLQTILGEHLPAHLEEWRTQGLPALIRCRDS